MVLKNVCRQSKKKLLFKVVFALLPHQNTALHIAARAGHVAAVRLMLVKGAELILNKNHTSFLHEAVQNGRKDVVNAVVDSERWVFYKTKGSELWICLQEFFTTSCL